jgi:hypothetical protein
MLAVLVGFLAVVGIVAGFALWIRSIMGRQGPLLFVVYWALTLFIGYQIVVYSPCALTLSCADQPAGKSEAPATEPIAGLTTTTEPQPGPKIAPVDSKASPGASPQALPEKAAVLDPPQFEAAIAAVLKRPGKFSDAAGAFHTCIVAERNKDRSTAMAACRASLDLLLPACHDAGFDENCSTMALTAAIRAYDYAVPPRYDQPAVEWDRETYWEQQRAAKFIGEADVCVHDVVLSRLNMGDRDRERLIRFSTDFCDKLALRFAPWAAPHFRQTAEDALAEYGAR